jgi:site-specific DNA recombinase
MERMIDSLAEGLSDKNQFTSRVARTKARIAELDAKIASQVAQDEQRAHVRAVMSRLTELSDHLRSQLKDADWGTKREIIRAVVQRIEIGPKKISVVLRLPTQTGARVF